MTITTDPFRRPARSGFTLVELLLTMVVSSMILAGILGTWLFIAKSSVAIAEYSDMNAFGRRGLEYFARDVRMAHAVSNFSSTGLTLDVDGVGTVRYEFDSVQGVFRRKVGDTESIIFRDVEELRLSRINILRNPAANDLETKQIQIDALVSTTILSRRISQKIISAQYIMRNKKVST
jgi:prepilin-type N-terminal cleavage/methylation domain-containing protein